MLRYSVTIGQPCGLVKNHQRFTEGVFGNWIVMTTFRGDVTPTRPAFLRWGHSEPWLPGVHVHKAFQCPLWGVEYCIRRCGNWKTWRKKKRHFTKMFAHSLEAVGQNVGQKLVCRKNTEHSAELNMTVCLPIVNSWNLLSFLLRLLVNSNTSSISLSFFHIVSSDYTLPHLLILNPLTWHSHLIKSYKIFAHYRGLFLWDTPPPQYSCLYSIRSTTPKCIFDHGIYWSTEHKLVIVMKGQPRPIIAGISSPGSVYYSIGKITVAN